MAMQSSSSSSSLSASKTKQRVTVLSLLTGSVGVSNVNGSSTKDEDEQQEAEPIVPPVPSSFFGRAHVVRNTVGFLLYPHPVALVGTGGIGKTSIAKAVINDPDIVTQFGAHRFFITYEDMDVSQITLDTFLDRIAVGIALIPSKASRQASISAYMSSLDSVLLILDNAEAFLDGSRDGAGISSAIEEFGAIKSVSILLTSDSGLLPRDLPWKLIPVPCLEKNAARLAFRTVHTGDIPSEILDQLLTTVDLHPLSINILAKTALQNSWSLEHLAALWAREQTRLLKAKKGKVENLMVTLELSLRSPSLSKLGDDVRRVLQILAFLPQGVDKNRLLDIFPSVLIIHDIIDTLCGLSLTYLNNDFITMHPPIRRYISSTLISSSSSIPLLTDVRTYYRRQLNKWGSTVLGEPEYDGRSWIETEDLNVEKLLSLDLTNFENINATSIAFMQFIDHLHTHKPRPTSLAPTVLALPEVDPSRVRCFCCAISHVSSSTRRLMSMKGNCIEQLGRFSITLGQYSEAVELLTTAADLFLRCNDETDMLECMDEVGDTYASMGQYVLAENTLRPALKVARDSKRLGLGSRITVELGLSLGRVRRSRGGTDAKEILETARRSAEGIHSKRYVSEALKYEALEELFDGDLQTAKQHFQAGLGLHPTHSSDDVEARYSFVMGLAEVAIRKDKWLEAHKLLDSAHGLSLLVKNFDHASFSLAIKAALVADQGDLTISRDLIKRASEEMLSASADESGVVASDANTTMINESAMYIAYVSARTELYAHELPKARDLFTKAKDISSALPNIEFRARSERALGEIALLEGNITVAMVWFVDTKSLCNTMGIPPNQLYHTLNTFKLKDSFQGWDRFLSGDLSSKTV